MSDISERIFNDGSNFRAVEAAKNFILKGKNTLEEISEALELPLEEVQEIARSLKEGASS